MIAEDKGKNPMNTFTDSVFEYYKVVQIDPHGRLRSWEYCYQAFCSARGRTDADIDYLSLQLAFYLASWGMYRGSSFLLQKDYKIHIPVVTELLKTEYDPLEGIECRNMRMEENQRLLLSLNQFLQEYYDRIRREVKSDDLKNKLSDTLTTKILMGTLSCVPAYDRFFVDGVKRMKVSTGTYNVKSLLGLVDFYEQNNQDLEEIRQEMKVGNSIYPQFKLLDMGFWQIGYGASTE